jgi:Flp pilus assembly protein TadG
MSITTLIRSLRNRLHAFRTAQHGNIAVIFALTLVPVMGFIGAAVDYSRASSDRAAMQSAIDATALMLSKDVATLTSSDMPSKATAYFNALYTRTDSTGVTVVPTYTTSGGSQLVVTGSATVPTKFMKIMGVSTMNIGVSSTVKWGNTKLRVALALDNTGSMSSSSKMTALKTATKSLLTQLQAAAAQNGDVYVSIIPFAKDVNVDPVNYNQTWIEWDDGTDASWDGANGTCSKSAYSTRGTCVAQGTCSKSGYTSQSTCVAQSSCSKSAYTTQATCVAQGNCSVSTYTTQATCIANGICSKSSHTTASSCASANGNWTLDTWTPAVWTAVTWTVATWTPDNHNTWNGCAMDRDQDYDTTNTPTSTATPATLIPAEQYATYCPTPLMALSYDWTALGKKVDAMVPNGGTNQAIGLQWAFQSLTSAPFTIPAMDSNYKYKKVIILLTDGLNTQNRLYGNGSDPEPKVDARQKILCDNIKAAGALLKDWVIYTVQVNTGGDPTSTLLQNCASDSNKFFLLTSSTGIVTTFNQIGTELSNLRVAK